MGFPLVLRSTIPTTVSGDRTNLALQSQAFQTTWTTTNASVSADAVVAVDGTLTGDKLVEDATAAVQHRINQSITVISGVPYTFSVWAKAAERPGITMRVSTATDVAQASFNLISGSVSGAFGQRSYMLPAARGWFRCVITGITDSTTATVRVNLNELPSNNSVVSYNGDGVSGVYLWGAQLEQALDATEYITTTASAATGPGSRSRLMGFYVVGGAAASSLQFKDGNSSGTTYVNIDVPAGAGIGTPGFVSNNGGVVFQRGIYLDITGTPTGVTVYYEK